MATKKATAKKAVAKKSAPLSETEKKAKKAAYEKERRAKAKAKAGRPIDVLEPPVVKKVTAKAEVTPPIKAKVETPKVEKAPVVTTTKKFDFPVRLFWNRRFEEKNSSCAKAEVELTFEEIETGKNGNKTYRVRRGKRNFFTNTAELAKSGVKSL